MARSRRTAPRTRRRSTVAAERTAAAAPTSIAPAAPADTRLTKKALRAHVRRSKKPVFNVLGGFSRLEQAGEDGMDAIRRAMR